MATTIEEFVLERGIKVLTHFTRASNLASILSRGLLTRDALIAEGSDEVCNDQHRIDGTNAVCLTIGFPNYKMFWSLRQNNPTIEWVVLAINPKVLWQESCAFCTSNAASLAVTNTPLAARKTLTAFKGMYSDFEGTPRSVLNLPDQFPTNPQAEILMLNGVPRQNIFGAYALNSIHQQQLKSRHPELDVRVYAAYYRYRADYMHWKS